MFRTCLFSLVFVLFVHFSAFFTFKLFIFVFFSHFLHGYVFTNVCASMHVIEVFVYLYLCWWGFVVCARVFMLICLYFDFCYCFCCYFHITRFICRLSTTHGTVNFLFGVIICQIQLGFALSNNILLSSDLFWQFIYGNLFIFLFFIVAFLYF